MTELDNKLAIQQYMHCGKCLDEIPNDVSPHEWAELEVGWTELGLQVWCKRHECNVIHIDFEGHKHPVDMTTTKKPELKSVI